MKTYEYARIQSDGHVFFCSDPETTKIIIGKNGAIYRYVSIDDWRDKPFGFFNGYYLNRTELGPFYRDTVLENMVVFMILRCLLDHGWEPFAADSQFIHLRLEKTPETVRLPEDVQATHSQTGSETS